MNLTLSVDEVVVERARQVALARGTSLNALIRQYLEDLGGSRAELAAELAELYASAPADSGGYVFRREDAYEARR